MILGDPTASSTGTAPLTTESVVADEAPARVVIASVGILLDGLGASDATQTARLIARSAGVVAASRPFDVPSGQPQWWATATIDDPLVLDEGALVEYGVQSVAGTAVVRVGTRAGAAVAYAHAVARWAPPAIVSDEVLADFPLDVAQAALTTGGTGTVTPANLGWRYDLDEPPATASLLARADGPLAAFVGERVRVTAGGSSVVVYVTDAQAFDPTLAAEDGQLSRAAFAKLAPLPTALLPALLEVLG